MFQSRAGLPRLLKEGAQHLYGTEDAVLRNIEAVGVLSRCCQTSFGPGGMNKLIVSHIEKTFVTSDAFTIAKELEVQHPAAKILVAAAEMQNSEFGDATNLVISLGGEFLKQAGSLCREGIHVSDILSGYELASTQALVILDSLVCHQMGKDDLKNNEAITKVLRPVLASKMRSFLDHYTNLTVNAILSVVPNDPKLFNSDNIRVHKVTGGSTLESCVVSGMVISKEPSTTCKKKTKCNVMLLNCGLEMVATESKGTVLLHNAQELLNFTSTEEKQMDDLIKSIKDAGVEVIIVGGSISGLALHYLNKYELLAVTTFSKFELRRIARTLNASPLARIGAPTPDEMGYADEVSVSEISSKLFTIVTSKDTKVSTIMLRGSSVTQLDEVERAIDDAVACYKSCTKDGRFVAGAGATEIELSHQLQAYAATFTGLQQYAISRFADSLEVIPRTLAENAGHKATNTIFKLHAAHRDGMKHAGVDITSSESRIKDVLTNVILQKDRSVADAAVPDALEHFGFSDLAAVSQPPAGEILDHYLTKKWALKLCVNAVSEILRVNHIIMSKPSGGPKFPKQGHWDARGED